MYSIQLDDGHDVCKKIVMLKYTMNVNKCPDEQDLRDCFEENEKVRNDGLHLCKIMLESEPSNSQDDSNVNQDNQ